MCVIVKLLIDAHFNKFQVTSIIFLVFVTAQMCSLCLCVLDIRSRRATFSTEKQNIYEWKILLRSLENTKKVYLFPLLRVWKHHISKYNYIYQSYIHVNTFENAYLQKMFILKKNKPNPCKQAHFIFSFNDTGIIQQYKFNYTSTNDSLFIIQH